MQDIVRQLIELPQSPGRQLRPPPGSQRIRAVVEAFSVAQEEVDEQEHQQKGCQHQIDDRHPSANANQSATCPDSYPTSVSVISAHGMKPLQKPGLHLMINI